MAWVRCPMPPNTLRVHTEYVPVKSVGTKVFWAFAAETTSAEDWRIFPSPSVPCLNYGGGDQLYKEPQVIQVIRSNRLRWLGHIWRSPENNQTRAYTFKNPMGSRTRGRPPTRWIDNVENDLKILNIKNWQRVAAYRWNWRKRAVEAAKTCNRLIKHLHVSRPQSYGFILLIQLFRIHGSGSLMVMVWNSWPRDVSWVRVLEQLKTRSVEEADAR
ncbi:endonuclease-reverse transcriptase [Trichonephila clavipes]|nr:endonuclease-reverse transcriptase [Trichonephila clavipes]